MEPEFDIHFIELFNGNNKKIINVNLIKTVLNKACKRSNLNVVKIVTHVFDNNGLTLIMILSESHLAFHSWPEHNYANIIMQTCSDKFNVNIFVDEIMKNIEFDTNNLKHIKK